MIPCPFCGGGVRFNAYFSAFMCNRCEALGPRGETREAAAEAWNTRFFGAAPEQPEDEGLPD